MAVIKPKSKQAVRRYRDGVDEGRDQGIEQRIVRLIERRRQLLRRLVELKFGVEAARKLAEVSAQPSRPDFEAVYAAAMDCDTADEFMAWMGEHAARSIPPRSRSG